MNKVQEKIFELAIPYLQKGVVKDFVTHTKGVIKSMELLLKKEKGDARLLIPAAILHDTGFSKVPVKYQKTKDRKLKVKGMELHLFYAPDVINQVLPQVGFNSRDVRRICEIVISHKFKRPRDLDKQLLIDADNLSDVFKEQFYMDARSYKQKPIDLLEYRVKTNRFYTKTAQDIFEREVNKRRKEIK
jgi:hypothetical protein